MNNWFNRLSQVICRKSSENTEYRFYHASMQIKNWRMISGTCMQVWLSVVEGILVSGWGGEGEGRMPGGEAVDWQAEQISQAAAEEGGGDQNEATCWYVWMYDICFNDNCFYDLHWC